MELSSHSRDSAHRVVFTRREARRNQTRSRGDAAVEVESYFLSSWIAIGLWRHDIGLVRVQELRPAALR